MEPSAPGCTGVLVGSLNMHRAPALSTMSYSILCCGSNGSFQLGLGNYEDQFSLKKSKGINESVLPKKLAFGGNHTLILYPNGNLYAAGDNQFGQCACETPKVLKIFTKVPGKWADVSAGWEWTILCDVNGRVYSCGCGLKGELGLGENTTNAGTPQEIELPTLHKGEAIAQVVSSITHTLMRLNSGRVIGWGACRKGQLGPQRQVLTKSGKWKACAAIWRPMVLDIARVDDICVGRDCTVLIGDRVHFLGDRAPREEDLSLMANAKTIRTMWSSIHYTQESAHGPGSTAHGEGPVYSFGNNSHGQLYRYGPAKIQSLEVGSEHGLLLLANNRVATWGWGEHGNCGPLNNDKVTFDQLSTIYTGKEKVVMVGGGLATSWVITEAEA